MRDFQHLHHLSESTADQVLDYMADNGDEPDVDAFIAVIGAHWMTAFELGVVFAQREPEAATEFVTEFVPRVFDERMPDHPPLETRERQFADHTARIANGCDHDGEPL